MSNVLIGIIGVILFIGLALAGALFLGGKFSDASNESEAARIISEGAQINRAFEMHRVEQGALPDGAGESGDANERAIAQLQTRGYLKSIPEGASGKWHVSEQGGSVLSLIGTGEGAGAICATARKQAGFTDEPKSCSDSSISDGDPCCIG